MKKKFLACALSVAMIATALVGCGNNNNNDVADDNVVGDVENDANDIIDAAGDQLDLSDANVAAFYYTYSDTYIASVLTALDAALTDMGVSFQDYDANSNQTTQNEQIDTAISTRESVTS